MKAAKITIAIAATAMLAGCAGIAEQAALYKGKVEKIERIEGNDYKLICVQPWEVSLPRFRESMTDIAKFHCTNLGGKGARLLDSVSRYRAGGQGSEGVLFFRCVDPMKAPESSLFGEDDEKLRDGN